MAKIQRVPRGLLALLGIVGENPPGQLEQAYRAAIDVSGLVIAELPLSELFTVNAAAVAGSTAVLTVPSGEAWFVEGAFAVINTPTAAAENQISLNRNTVVEDIIWAVPGVTVLTAGPHTAFKSFTPPTVLLAGERLSATLNATSSGVAQALVVFAQFRRILV